MILPIMYEPNRILDIIAQEGVSAMLSVPTMLVSMIEMQRKRTRDLKS